VPQNFKFTGDAAALGALLRCARALVLGEMAKITPQARNSLGLQGRLRAERAAALRAALGFLEKWPK
jgi:hypothetical protein